MPPLHSILHKRLLDERNALDAQGDLPSADALDQYYRTFRQRFGPDVLRSLEGDSLLTLLKGSGRDGLVYWLEYKNDDEFPDRFGRIAGGSALKFGLYRRKETGEWMTGAPAGQRPLSRDEAARIAHSHRDQLLAACDTLSRFRELNPEISADAAYQDLQESLARVAPDVQDSAWGHKYLSLLFPDVLDDYHALAYQQFHLVKLLQLPTDNGRYSNAGRFRAIRLALEWPVNHLTTVLNRLHGAPYRYWRLGTTSDSGVSFWPDMHAHGEIAIGWSYLGDLSAVLASEPPLREYLRGVVNQHEPASPAVVGRSVQQVLHFCTTIQNGDYVVACDGGMALGMGRVTGSYSFRADHPFPHRRSVEWLHINRWKLPKPQGLLRSTVRELRRAPENRIEVERQLLEELSDPVLFSAGEQVSAPPGSPATTVPVIWIDGGTIGRIQDVLNRKGQVILYGPPGTGKTYWAESAVQELASRWNVGSAFAQLTDRDRRRMTGETDDSFVVTCCFHPGYGYEDFIEGYRPMAQDGALHFAVRDGLFKRLCDRAARDPEHRYYAVIDEINRGDIPRIFGELISLLDKPKRGTTVLLPASGTRFTVPSNLFIVATMNTADRSIALLDTALRRRFGFIELQPDVRVLGETVVAGIPLGPWLAAVNVAIARHVGRDGRSLQIGHSYFLADGRPIQDFWHLARVLQEDVLPLLEEYCYEDWGRLEQIAGSRLVDVTAQRFRSELFEPNRQDDLIQAILAGAPDIRTSPIAVAADAAAETETEAQDVEDEDDEAPS